MNLCSSLKLVFSTVVKIQSSTRSTALLYATQVKGMSFCKMLQIPELKQHKPDKLLCLCHLLTPAATHNADLQQRRLQVTFSVGINRDSCANSVAFGLVYKSFFLPCIFLPGVYIVQFLKCITQCFEVVSPQQINKLLSLVCNATKTKNPQTLQTHKILNIKTL